MTYAQSGAAGLALAAILFLLGFAADSLHAFRFANLLELIGLIAAALGMRLLVWGWGDLRPGAAPDRCSTWGHDMRWHLEEMPPGATCRNCLTRQDGAFLVYSAPPPEVNVVLDWRFGGYIPAGLARVDPREFPNALILADQPDHPRVGYGPGVYMWWAAPLWYQLQAQREAQSQASPAR